MSAWTIAVDDEAKEFFPTLSTAEIRRRQDLCQQQQVLAHRARNTQALEALNGMDAALAREMMRRLDAGTV